MSHLEDSVSLRLAIHVMIKHAGSGENHIFFLAVPASEDITLTHRYSHPPGLFFFRLLGSGFHFLIECVFLLAGTQKQR